METGMLWFDDSNRPLTEKVELAVAYYQDKYEESPNLCAVHPSMLPEGDTKVGRSRSAARPPSCRTTSGWAWTRERRARATGGERPPEVSPLTDWSDLRVVVIGLARQGKALARYLSTEGAEVIVSDRKPADQLVEARRQLAGLPIRYVFGGHPLELLDDADRLCLSGGVPSDLPIVQEAGRRGIPILNDSQILLEGCPCLTVGITGSAGKSTTTALLGAMAAADTSRRTWVGGNIGRPLLTDLPEMSPDDLVVVELSSFQLEWMTVSPKVAAVLNITPNHLDRHVDMADYTRAKAQILAHQSSSDMALLGHDDPGAWGLRSEVRGRLASFGVGKPPEDTGAFIEDGQMVWISDGSLMPLAPLGSLSSERRAQPDERSGGVGARRAGWPARGGHPAGAGNIHRSAAPS